MDYANGLLKWTTQMDYPNGLPYRLPLKNTISDEWYVKKL